MTISAVLLWALLIGGILAVVRYLGRTSQQQPPRSDISHAILTLDPEARSIQPRR